jgi:hypothetical protein
MYGLNIQYSELLLEGGNSVAGTNFVIITEKVIRNNPHLKPAEIVSQLQQLLEVDKVILIPTEPGDVIGHADGMVQVLNSTTLLVNNYSSSNYSAHFRRKFYGALAELGMNMILMPYNPVIEMSSDGIPQAIGCYMNYIRIGNQVFLPQFNSMIDIEAAEVFQRYAPELTIHQLPAQAIARNGGVFHCMTWWMNAEQLEPKQYCPICAKEVSYNSRYPNYVCRSCSEMTKSPDGRSIQFYNSDILGDGVTGIYTGTDEVYHSTSCLIGGKLCKAEEARFGGIVIQVI